MTSGSEADSESTDLRLNRWWYKQCPDKKSGAGVTGHRFSFPCRFKQRDDGSYFIRFPDLPEAMVDRVEQADLYRSASRCLASVLYWRVTNEIELPNPSRPRPGQHMIELGRVRALSEAIASGRPPSSNADVVVAPTGAVESRPAPVTPDHGDLGPLAISAE